MSFRLVGLVLASEAQVSSSELLVLVTLASFADDSGGSCFPSAALLSKRTRFTTRAIRSILQHLHERGAIEIVPRGRRRYRSAAYRINVDFLASPPAAAARPKVPKDQEHEQVRIFVASKILDNPNRPDRQTALLIETCQAQGVPCSHAQARDALGVAEQIRSHARRTA